MGNYNCVQDKKREYLIKTLSRTKRKDYENYVVNGIWHKLNRPDLQPVTQQYVKRSDGKYALIDLYFPQLNFGIECDEAYHINNSIADEVRVSTMEEMLASIEEKSDFILRRINAYKSIESIEKQIQSIVDEMNDLLNVREIKLWDINSDPAEVAIAKKELDVSDRLQFETIANICKCFGKSYKGMQRSYFNINNNFYIWCPKLAIVTEGSVKAVSNGWINTLSDDWDKISERNENSGKDFDITARNPSIPRATFAKSRDVLGRNTYRFIGVFVYSKECSSVHENIYLREKSVLNLDAWL